MSPHSTQVCVTSSLTNGLLHQSQRPKVVVVIDSASMILFRGCWKYRGNVFFVRTFFFWDSDVRENDFFPPIGVRLAARVATGSRGVFGEKSQDSEQESCSPFRAAHKESTPRSGKTCSMHIDGKKKTQCIFCK